MEEGGDGPGMDRDLVATVRRAQAGDLDAFGELVARFQDFVYGLAYHLTGSFEEARDLAQEAFVRAFQRVGELSDPACFAGWLRQITVSVCLNALPAMRRHAGLSLEEAARTGRDLVDPSPEPAEAAEASEQRRAVLDAVNRLPSDYGLPLTLYYLDGLSLPAVGEFLGLSPAAAKMRVHRARQMVRRELAAMFEDAFRTKRLPEEFPLEVRRCLEHFGREYGAECVLLNPEVLSFERDAETGAVVVLASAPLRYRSDEFGYLYTVRTPRMALTASDALDCERNWQTAEALEPASEEQARRWEANRRARYAGSKPHFLHAWAYQREEEEGFEILHPPGGPILRQIGELMPGHLNPGPEFELNQGGLFKLVVPGGELRVRYRPTDAVGILRTDESDPPDLQGQFTGLGHASWGTDGYWGDRAGWSFSFDFLVRMHYEERARWTASGGEIVLRPAEVELQDHTP